jgi:exodeoxyribonuclease VII small subunit
MPSVADLNDLTFEAALKELEAIVERLETGDVPLEESIRTYERGAALRSHCERLLKSAQLRVDQIVQGGDNGLKLEPLDAGQG